MTALCRSCDGEFDANDFCPRCQHYASEQLPEKTLDQLFDEYPAVRAYRDALRSRLWGFDVLGEQLERDLRFTQELQDDAARAARAATPSGLSRSASSCQHRIAIARKSA